MDDPAPATTGAPEAAEPVEATPVPSSDCGSSSTHNNWTEAQEQLLVSWSRDLLSMRMYHHSKAGRLDWSERLLWIPNLLLITTSAVLQQTTFANSTYILMALNMVSSGLVALEKFLDFKGRTIKHRHLCAECWRVYSEISFQLSIPPQKRADSCMFVEKVRGPYNAIVSEVSNKVSLGFQIIRFQRRPCRPFAGLLRNNEGTPTTPRPPRPPCSCAHRRRRRGRPRFVHMLSQAALPARAASWPFERSLTSLAPPQVPPLGPPPVPSPAALDHPEAP